MSKLVTGASGFVGSALCAELRQRGEVVRAAVRTQRGNLTGEDEVVVGELDSQTDWSAALDGVEVVFHLAARVHVMQDTAADPLTEFRRVNVAATENLARQAARAGVKRLVFVSSIKVNGEGTALGQTYTEADPPAPQDPYGISKWEAEQMLHRVAAETGLEVVILRPPLMYGVAVKGNFIRLLQAIDRGLPLPLAAATDNVRSLLYLGNFVDALITCAHHPAAAGQTYLVSDGQPLSTAQLVASLAAALGRPNPAFRFPPRLLYFLGRLLGHTAALDRLFGSLHINDQKIRQQLDWQPPYTMAQGLREIANWYRTAHTSP